MTFAARMLGTHPSPSITDRALTDAIQAAVDCAQACTACADACLGESEHLNELVKCIHLNLDCGDICEVTARELSRQTHFTPNHARSLVQACADACRECAEECEKHAEMGMEHCRVCAEACRRCEEACNALLSSLNA